MTAELTEELEENGLTAEAPPAPADPTPDPEPEAEEEDVDKTQDEEQQEDSLEIILPSAEQREWTVGDQSYVQKPLSFVRRMQFFAVVARALKHALNQGGSDVLADLLGGGQSVRNLASLGEQDLTDAGEFMGMIFSLVEYAPDLITDSYCVWLNVPPVQRPWVKAAWAGDLEEQGIEALSDEDAKTIIEVFIVQNWGAIVDFFRRDVAEIAAVARKQAKQEADQE